MNDQQGRLPSQAHLSPLPGRSGWSSGWSSGWNWRAWLASAARTARIPVLCVCGACALPLVATWLTSHVGVVAQAEGSRGHATLEIAGLVQQLDSEKAADRREAAYRLALKGREAESALPALHARLKDPDQVVQAHAARAVWEIGQDADAAVPVLSELLNSPQSNLAALAAYMLGEVGSDAKPALAVLQSLTVSKDALIRLHAAEAIAKIAPSDPRALEVLVRGVHDEDADVRYLAVYALSACGNHSPEKVILELTAALSDPDLRVASAAALTLDTLEQEAKQPAAREMAGKAQGQPSLEVRTLVGNLGDDDADVRKEAALRLGSLGKAAKGAIPSLVQMLDDPDPVVRAYTARAIWEIDRLHELVIPVLNQLLGTTSPNASTVAAFVLGDIGTDAAETLSSLRELLDGSDALVRLHAAEAITKIAPQDKVSLALLIDALKDKDSDIRYLAAFALANAPTAERVRVENALTLCLQDRNLRVRSAAESSIQLLQFAAESAEATRLAQHEAQAKEVAAADEPPPVTATLEESDPLEPEVAPTEPEPTIEERPDPFRVAAEPALPPAIAESEIIAEESAPMQPAPKVPAHQRVLARSAPPIPEIEPIVRPAPKVAYEELPDDDFLRPIGAVRANINPTIGDLPANHAAPKFETQLAVYHGFGGNRGWTPASYFWEAPAIYYNPLYFQDISAERYGYHYGCLQPAVSGACFFGTVAILPYKFLVSPLCEPVYTLGYDRPGNCVPFRCYMTRCPWDAPWLKRSECPEE